MSKTLYLLNLTDYGVLPEGVVSFLIKMDDLLEISWHLESIILSNGLSLSIGIKDIEHPDEIIRMIGKASCSIPIVHVKYPIVSCICIKDGIVIFIYFIHSILYILSIFPYHLDIPITIL